MAVPFPYNADIGNTICHEIAAGRSLRSICAKPDMPSLPTVYEWLRESESFADQYARAREAQADTLAEEIQDIADDTDHDNMGAVQKAKLQVDARKWIAAKLKPSRYSDRQQVEISGTITLGDVLRDAAAIRARRQSGSE